MHIINAVCKRRGLTHEKFAAAVRNKSGKDSPGKGYISQIVTGAGDPSKELCGEIADAFPEIRAAWLAWPERYQEEILEAFPECAANDLASASGE